MNLSYQKASYIDVDSVYELCKQLIIDYENLESIDLEKVLKWVHHKIETCIDEYQVIYTNDEKAGYYHFFLNEDGEYELDDLYIYPSFQNKGIGTKVIEMCCATTDAPVMLYVFIKNKRAVSLYKKLGFEVIETINNSRYIMRRNK